jgi:hypothetical protein
MNISRRMCLMFLCQSLNKKAPRNSLNEIG